MKAFTVLPMDKPLKCSGCGEVREIVARAEWNEQSFGYCKECAEKREKA